MNKRVYLGMSGGVDSSVSALLLKEQGYDVTGVYMKNWSEDLPGMKCPWAEDLADAKRVAVQLDLDFEVWDFEKDYKAKVVDYMLAEFKKGRTPNPDVMCNELIKFKLFYDWAIERGADFIATGHYAQVSPVKNANQAETDSSETAAPAKVDLLKAVDANKDQTYFLYRMSDAATAKTLFPIGAMTKPEVKQLAAERKLDVATKKESMGICFVGEVGMKDFLQQYLDAKPGEIREQETGEILGYHDGAIFYTIGQRHGLYLGGGLPYYVVGKDLAANIVYVSKNLNHESLWTTELTLESLHLRSGRTLADIAKLAAEPSRNNPNRLQVRLRHRAPLIDCKIDGLSEREVAETSIFRGSPEVTTEDEDARPPRRRAGATSCPENLEASAVISFSQPIKRPAPGQSAVLYSGEICLGGGIIAE